MRRKQSGQLMIIVALGMVAFLGFAALAIDLGRGYSERRNAQNAADAAALAGMRLVREPTSPSMTGLDVYNAMVAVAAQNGGAQILPDASSGAVFLDASKNPLSPNPNIDAWTSTDFSSVYGIRVRTRIQYNTFFAGVLGYSQLNSGGVATAMSIGVNPLGALMPIAFQSQGGCSGGNFGFTVGTPYTFIDTGSVGGSQIGWISFDGSGSASNLGNWVTTPFTGNFFYYEPYNWDGIGMDPVTGPDHSVCDDSFYYDGGSGIDPTATTKTNPHPVLVPSPSTCDGGNGDCDLQGGAQTNTAPTSAGDVPKIVWFKGNSGQSGNSAIQAVWPNLPGHDIVVVIYNKVDKISTGNNLKYQVVGWAGFSVTSTSITPGLTITGVFKNIVIGGMPTPVPSAGNATTVRLVPN